jgi:hypothetical protein
MAAKLDFFKAAIGEDGPSQYALLVALEAFLVKHAADCIKEIAHVLKVRSLTTHPGFATTRPTGPSPKQVG